MSISIYAFVTGPIETNTYFVLDKETGDAFLIDPGPGSDEKVSFFKDEGYRPSAILLTHAHWDHIACAKAYHEAYGIPRIIWEREDGTLTDPEVNCSGLLSGRDETYEVEREVKDGQTISLPSFSITCLGTPGHTPGGASWYLPAEGILFSGDSLFRRSIGRTDFPGGSMEDLISSLKEKVMILPDETRVLPGHGPETTVGTEKRYNPYLSEPSL